MLKFLRVSLRYDILLFHELFTNHIFLFFVVGFVFVLYAFPPYYLIIMPGKSFFLTDRFFVVVSLAIAPVPRQWIKPSIVIIATAMTTIHIHRHHADDICVVVVDASSSSTSCPVVLLYVEHSSFAIRRSSLI